MIAVKNLAEAINEQEKILKQLKARAELKLNRDNKKQSEQERKDDTRRKILIGSLMLNKMQNDDDARQKIINDLNNYLVLDRDRKLFDLPVLL